MTVALQGKEGHFFDFWFLVDGSGETRAKRAEGEEARGGGPRAEGQGPRFRAGKK